MAKREQRKQRKQLKPWHHQVTTALAVVTLLVVVAFFGQTFMTFFLTDEDPVLIAVERLKERAAGSEASE